MGTANGGRKAAAKNLERDPDFYKKIGRMGGVKSRGGGFTGDPVRASMLGKIGGSRRSKMRQK